MNHDDLVVLWTVAVLAGLGAGFVSAWMTDDAGMSGLDRLSVIVGCTVLWPIVIVALLLRAAWLAVTWLRREPIARARVVKDRP